MHNKRTNTDEADTKKETDEMPISRAPYMELCLSNIDQTHNDEDAAK
jgi:hypothetical protein